MFLLYIIPLKPIQASLFEKDACMNIALYYFIEIFTSPEATGVPSGFIAVTL